MESTEKELHDLILSRYGSVRKFANEISMAQSTIDSILKRGLSNSNVTSIMKICNKLQIDVELLSLGKIVSSVSRLPMSQLTDAYNKATSIKDVESLPSGLYITNATEISIVENFRTLNEEGQKKIIEYIDDLTNSGKY